MICLQIKDDISVQEKICFILRGDDELLTLFILVMMKGEVISFYISFFALPYFYFYYIFCTFYSFFLKKIVLLFVFLITTFNKHLQDLSK